MAFSNLINEQPKVKLYKTHNGYAYLYLEYEKRSYSTNSSEQETRKTVQCCYLAPLTMAILGIWNRKSKKIKKLSPKENSRQVYLALAKEHIKTVNYPKTLIQLCSAGALVCEQLDNVELSQALIEYSIGKIKSYSLPLSNQHFIHLENLHNCTVFNYKTQTPTIKSQASNVLSKQIYNTEFFQHLKVALKKGEIKQKESKKQIAERLYKLSKADLNTTQLILCKWFIEKLEFCKPSTLRTYHSTISRRWLSWFERIDFINLKTEDLEQIYSEIIDQTSSLKRKSDVASLLSQIHEFLVKELGIEPLAEPLYGSNVRKHTSAGIVDEKLFYGLINQIEKVDDLTVLDKSSLRALFIIGFRCGLRISELLKLRLCDIENSAISWIEVRNNKFGNNKTASAKRKIPLFPLLLESEKQEMKHYLAQKRAHAQSKTNLVFTIGTDSNKPIDKFELNNFTKQVIKELSGLNWLTFHHLRHSCLSRLQLIFEAPELNQSFCNIIPYSATEIKAIQKIVNGSSKKNYYYAICELAGHSSPQECFNTYIHFSDLIIGHKMFRANVSLSKTQLMALRLCSKRKYSDVAYGNSGSIYPEPFIQKIYKKLKFVIPVAQAKADLTPSKTIQKSSARISIKLCHDVLARLFNGQDIRQIMNDYNLSMEQIEKWKTNAEYLSESLLHASFGKKGIYLPTPPRTTKELRDLDNWINTFRKIYKENHKTINHAIKYALSHITKNVSGVSFNCPKELAYFLKITGMVIPKSHWRIVKYSIETSRIKDSWLDVFKGYKTKTSVKSSLRGRTGIGVVRLELIHPEEKQITSNQKLSRYSSNGLIYLFHMIAIMMLNVSKVTYYEDKNGQMSMFKPVGRR